MAYCPKCGSRLPAEEDAKFCPNCGELLPSRAAKKSLLGVVSLEKRILILLATFALCVLVTALGAVSRVSPEEAQEMNRILNEMRESFEVLGPLAIFSSNFINALIMFIPIIGSARGLIVLYTTGRFIAGFGLLGGVNPLLLFIALFAFPFTWMEYVSYSLAISESIILTYSIIKRKLKREIRTTLITIAICAAVLLLAAWIESFFVL